MVEKGSSQRVAVSRTYGIWDILAIGGSFTICSLVLILPGYIYELAGRYAPWSFLIGMICYLPLILSYLEFASEGDGRSSPYFLLRGRAPGRMVFLTGWLTLSGYLALSALLIEGVSARVMVMEQFLFGTSSSEAAVVAAIMGLLVLSALIGAGNRMTILKTAFWIALSTLIISLVWIFWSSSTGEVSAVEIKHDDHWLVTVGILASGLWGIEQILDVSFAVRRSRKTIPVVSVSVWILVCLLGAAATAAILAHPEMASRNTWISTVLGERPIAILVILAFIFFCYVALSRIYSAALRLLTTMLHDGFLTRGAVVSSGRPAFIIILSLFSVLTAAFVIYLPIEPIGYYAALSFLWISVLALGNYTMRPSKARSDARWINLPSHPLIPFLAVGLSLFLSVLFPNEILLAGLVWIIPGLVYYQFYSRKGHIKVQQVDSILGMSEQAIDKSIYRILINANHDQAELVQMLKIGISLSQERKGEILLLRVIEYSNQLPVAVVQSEAQKEWNKLKELIDNTEAGGVSILPMVRLAPRASDGVIETASEFEVNSIFLKVNTSQEVQSEEREMVIEEVFSGSSRPLIAFYGDLSQKTERVVVALGDGPDVHTVLSAAEGLARLAEAELVLFRSINGEGQREAEQERIAELAEEAGLLLEYQLEISVAASLEQGIKARVLPEDLLIIGASVNPVLKENVLTGIPLRIARTRVGPTLIVKKAEGVTGFWLRRVWHFIYHFFPTVTVSEQTAVYMNMRRSARADADFYVLMTLASTIATAGLLLNSGAVVIGAMLVAPLMNPILAVGHGLVHGNVHMLKRGADATVRGVLLAIGVSTMIALLFPIKVPTAEILGRVQPNLFDLMVAMAAGAVAAYGISRESVSASLPGVAISVALVPPLCVTGYGLGISEFAIAGGALLLFATNLSSIILCGAITFLLLGFRPPNEIRKDRVGKGIVIALVAIIALAIPLGFSTSGGMKKLKLEAKITKLLHQRDKEEFLVDNLNVFYRDGKYVVKAVIFSYKKTALDRIEEIRIYLENQTGLPIEMDATVVPASRYEASESGGREWYLVE